MKLTDEIRDSMVALVRAGVDRATAAEINGITSRTFYNWMSWGRDGKKGFVEFAKAVEKADAECEGLLINYIMKSAKEGDWRAAVWRLSKKKPRTFGEKVEVTGDIAVSDKLSDEELIDRAAKAVERLRGKSKPE